MISSQVGGQGIASGFRDAISLAWRLAVLCRSGTPNYDSVLRGWYQERKQQLEASLASTIANGALCTESNALKITIRNLYYWLIALVPAWRHQLELGPRAQGVTRYKHRRGCPFLPDQSGGISVPQVFCEQEKEISKIDSGKQPLLTDDAIFSKSKMGICQLVVLADTMNEALTINEDLKTLNLEKCSQGYLHAHEATYIIPAFTEPVGVAPSGLNILATRSVKDLMQDKSLTSLDFSHYKPDRINKEFPGKKFLIVRQDRFSFAACSSVWELEDIGCRIPGALEGCT